MMAGSQTKVAEQVQKQKQLLMLPRQSTAEKVDVQKPQNVAVES